MHEADPIQRRTFQPAESPDGRSRWAVWLASGLGIGLATPAPGTIGGLWGVLLVCAISPLRPVGAPLAISCALALMAVLICQRAARALANGSDPGAIVLDEIVALPFCDARVYPVTWIKILMAYVLFRVFDIGKPFWVRWAERLPGGWGIVADDIVAALSACVVLHVLLSLATLAT